MIMSSTARENIWKMLLDHFPDGVDVVQVDPLRGMFSDVNGFEVTEEIYEGVPPPVIVGQDNAAPYSEVVFHLVELEPETGIYAGMSPITHSVYVYIDPRRFTDLI